MRQLRRYRRREKQQWSDEDKMKLPDRISRSEIESAVDEWIVGNHAERDRKILKRRLIDGILYEPLAEEFGLSVKQVKRIVAHGTDRMFKR